MYSSATRSSSASGLSGGGLFVLEGLGEREEEGEGEADESGEGAGEGEGEGLCLGDRVGFSEGVGAPSWRGFTGPVGFKGEAAVDFGLGDGPGVGDAARRREAPRQGSSAKMERRNLMGAAERQ